MRKMDQENGQKSILTSPVVLITLALAIIGVAAMYLVPTGALEPALVAPAKPAADVSPAPGNRTRGISASPSPEMKGLVSVVDGGERDPFLPPKLAFESDRSPRESKPVQPLFRPVEPKEPVATPEPVKSKPPEPEIVWKGVVSSQGKRVALVGYLNKTYLLLPGQQLPGTEYCLTAIEGDAFLFNSATSQLKVARTKGDAGK
jgi:hypothetical protein